VSACVFVLSVCERVCIDIYVCILRMSIYCDI